jgi:hypothetical protein
MKNRTTDLRSINQTCMTIENVVVKLEAEILNSLVLWASRSKRQALRGTLYSRPTKQHAHEKHY